MSIYHRATGKVLQSKQNWSAVILLANTAVALVTAALFIATATASTTDARNRFAVAGSLLTVVTALFQCFGFLVYGLLIVFRLRKHLTTDFTQRLFYVAVCFGLVFSGQTVVLLLTTVYPDSFTRHFDLYNAFYFTLDIVSQLLVLALFSKFVSDFIVDRSDISKLRSNSTNNPRGSQLVSQKSHKKSTRKKGAFQVRVGSGRSLESPQSPSFNRAGAPSFMRHQSTVDSAVQNEPPLSPTNVRVHSSQGSPPTNLHRLRQTSIVAAQTTGDERNLLPSSAQQSDALV